MSQPPALHRAMMLVDVESFGDPERTDAHRLAVRAGLYEALEQAFSESGIGWHTCVTEDRGDGVMIMIPPEVPKIHLFDRLPERLAAALRTHNDLYSERARIRLRVALHAGEISQDRFGLVGEALNFAFRLLEAPLFKQQLAASPGVLALITSDQMYREVVRNDPAAGARSYHQIPVAVKETETVAWVRLPDGPLPVPPELAQPPRQPELGAQRQPELGQPPRQPELGESLRQPELDQPPYREIHAVLRESVPAGAAAPAADGGTDGEAIRPLVDALEQVPSLREPAGRQKCLELLRHYLGTAFQVADQPAPRSHLHAIVLTCVQHPDGLRSLAKALAALEKDFGVVRGVQQVVRQLAAQRQDALWALVEALLEIPSVAEDSDRKLVLQQLRREVATAVPYHPKARLHVLGLVQTCLHYDGALEQLVRAVESIEGQDSIPVRRLREVVASMPAGLAP